MLGRCRFTPGLIHGEYDCVRVVAPPHHLVDQLVEHVGKTDHIGIPGFYALDTEYLDFVLFRVIFGNDLVFQQRLVHHIPVFNLECAVSQLRS